MCPKCKRYFRKKDNVVLDILNTVIHFHCVDLDYTIPLKNSGTFKKIVKLYPFYESDEKDALD